MHARRVPALAALALSLALPLGRAVAQPEGAPPAPPPAESVPAAPVPPEAMPAPAPAPEPAPPPPLDQPAGGFMQGPVSPGAMTDHDLVVGRWGVEARRLTTALRTPGQDPTCGGNCPVDLNAFSLRRWSTSEYAWSAGLALAIGGGSTRMDGDSRSWDTYLGVGPTVGAAFLIANWRHLAVSFAPQLDLVLFIPAASRGKTLLATGRGLFEGELHLGYWGVPQLSVGISSGLTAGYRYVTEPDTAAPGAMLSSEWFVQTTAPQTLWGLVTNMFLRFYM